MQRRLWLLMSGLAIAACTHRRNQVDLGCDIIQPSLEGRDWVAVLRAGTEAAPVTGDSGRILVRTFARADSVALEDVQAYAVGAGAVRIGRAIRTGQNTLLVVPSGEAFIRTVAHGRAAALVPTRVAAARVDTVDVYLGRGRTNCDANAPSPSKAI